MSDDLKIPEFLVRKKKGLPGFVIKPQAPILLSELAKVATAKGKAPAKVEAPKVPAEAPKAPAKGKAPAKVPEAPKAPAEAPKAPAKGKAPAKVPAPVEVPTVAACFYWDHNGEKKPMTGKFSKVYCRTVDTPDLEKIIDSKRTCDRLWTLRDEAMSEAPDLAKVRKAIEAVCKGLQILELFPVVPPGNVCFSVRTMAGGEYRFTLAEEIIYWEMPEPPKAPAEAPKAPAKGKAKAEAPAPVEAPKAPAEAPKAPAKGKVKAPATAIVKA